jgi:hypothetical protein
MKYSLVRETLYLGQVKCIISVFICYEVGHLHVQYIMLKHFFFTFNAIFGKIGRKLSDEVILKLFKTKCVPGFMYGLKAFDMTKSVLRSLNFSVIVSS